MDDLIRLIISDDRLKESLDNKLKLTNKESHYLNRVMRTKLGQEIFITNGKGLLWRGIKIQDNCLKVPPYKQYSLFHEKQKFLLGIAISIPKNGFEDTLKMCTEMGIDLIQPLYTERQVKSISNPSKKKIRWEKIINESVEQCERLWKPKLLDCLDILEWIPTIVEKDFISISVTRNDDSINFKKWLNNNNLLDEKKCVFWNVIGPEGGWSENELIFFNTNQIQLVRHSETILRTSTAAINASSILSQWRNDHIKLMGSI